MPVPVLTKAFLCLECARPPPSIPPFLLAQKIYLQNGLRQLIICGQSRVTSCSRVNNKFGFVNVCDSSMWAENTRKSLNLLFRSGTSPPRCLLGPTSFTYKIRPGLHFHLGYVLQAIKTGQWETLVMRLNTLCKFSL